MSLTTDAARAAAPCEAIGELNTPVRFLMGPGPSDVHPRVLRAMAQPLVGHLDPSFVQILKEVRELLQYVFQTHNEMTMAISGTGSAGMETVVTNLVEPGDEVVIGVNGVFGGRMVDVATRAGARVERVDVPWGEPVRPERIAEALKRCKSPKFVGVVHAETSTGCRTPLEEIGRLAHDSGALFLVDAVTSLGGSELRVDDWGIDAIYSGTQKCLSCPPGLSPVSFSERAMEVVRSRRTKCQSWYLDISMIASYWGEDRMYHHTAPISMVYALRESLRLVREEGLEARIARHAAMHERLKAGLERLGGYEFVVEEEYRLPQLNLVRFPAGVDEAAVRARLLNEFNIEIGAGLGDFKGKVWRIGLMGESCTANHVNMLLSALEELVPARNARP